MEEIDPENELNWQEASVKGRTKKEIYRIILMKGHYYLPPEVQWSSDFIHDIMVGKKRVSGDSIIIYRLWRWKML